MKLSRTRAEELSQRFAAISSDCEQTLRVTMQHQSLGEVKVYGQLVANFMGHVYADVLRPLWREFPELEPPQMREEWKEPTPELAPEVADAIGTFVREARVLLAEARELHSGAAGEAHPVAVALEAIVEFKEQPRFR